MSRLSAALDHLATRLPAVAGQTVTYTRGVTGASYSVTAIPGETLFAIDDQYAGTIREHRRDWLIAADQLNTGSVNFVPAAGDRITLTTADGALVTYEVAAPDGEPVWRWLDPREHIRRVHVVEIDRDLIVAP